MSVTGLSFLGFVLGAAEHAGHGGGIFALAAFVGVPTAVGLGVMLLTRRKEDDPDDMAIEQPAGDVDAD